MVNHILRQLSVQRRIFTAFLLVALTIFTTLPLFIVNQNALISHLNEVTTIETHAERLLLTASINIVQSRLDVVRYLERFTPTTSDAKKKIVHAKSLVEEARALTQKPEQLFVMDELLADLDKYYDILQSIDESGPATNSLSSVPAKTFELAGNLTYNIEYIVNASRASTLEASQAIQIEAQQRLRRILISYSTIFLVCLALTIPIGHSITKPIIELHNWALAIRAGNLDSPVTVTGKDELTDLAVTLNNVTGKLASLNSELAQQVAESTNQMVATMEHLKIAQFSVEYASDAIFWILPDGRIGYANQHACESLGFDKDELQSKSLYEVVPHLAKDRWNLHWQELKEAGTRVFDSAHVTKTGSTFPVEVRTNYQKIEGQEYIFGFTHNISARKATEQSLKAAKEDAEAANIAKSQFLSNMTHELRTPMNGVLGMTSLLYDTPLSEVQLDIVNTIRTSGDSLLTIINEVLDFSKIDAGKVDLEMSRFDICQSIEECLDLISVGASEKNIGLLYSLKQNAPRFIKQDATRFRQVLTNLLSNAVKFTEDGEVVITVFAEPIQPESTDDNPESAAETLQEPLKITVAVKDTGIGIPKDRTHRLFQSFSQVDSSTTRRFGGTGLGLAISMGLANAMGGTIWVESAVDIGSTFFFSFVAGTGVDLTEPNYPVISSDVVELRDKRIALCLESATIIRSVNHFLDSWGIRPVVVSNAAPLETKLRQLQNTDITIIDQAMWSQSHIDAQLAQCLQQQAVIFVAPLGAIKNKLPIPANVLRLTAPVKASQLQDALAMAINGIPQNSNRPVSSSADLPAQHTIQSVEVQVGHRRPVRILLAEDNLVNQKVALGILRKLGYSADVAGNGREAFEAVMQQSYDLILMDVSMPEMDGVTATQKIRGELSREHQPYIIAVTANAMPGDRENYLKAGMDDYVSKPIQIDLLRNAIERLPSDLEEEKNRSSAYV